MTITVTNTSAKLTALMSAGALNIANTNTGEKGLFRVTIYNADTTSTDIIYYAYGETATAAEGLPIFAPADTASAGDSYTVVTGDLTKINLIANVASTTANVIIEPYFI